MTPATRELYLQTIQSNNDPNRVWAYDFDEVLADKLINLTVLKCIDLIGATCMDIVSSGRDVSDIKLMVEGASKSMSALTKHFV